MQNLGYFQLKAFPGAMSIGLAGRSASLYDIVNVPTPDTHSGFVFRGRQAPTTATTVVETQRIVVNDFSGPLTQLRVQKKPGMEGVPLLHDGTDLAAAEGSDSVSPALAAWMTDLRLWISLVCSFAFLRCPLLLTSILFLFFLSLYFPCCSDLE